MLKTSKMSRDIMLHHKQYNFEFNYPKHWQAIAPMLNIIWRVFIQSDALILAMDIKIFE